MNSSERLLNDKRYFFKKFLLSLNERLELYYIFTISQKGIMIQLKRVKLTQ